MTKVEDLKIEPCDPFDVAILGALRHPGGALLVGRIYDRVSPVDYATELLERLGLEQPNIRLILAVEEPTDFQPFLDRISPNFVPAEYEETVLARNPSTCDFNPSIKVQEFYLRLLRRAKELGMHVAALYPPENEINRREEAKRGAFAAKRVVELAGRGKMVVAFMGHQRLKSPAFTLEELKRKGGPSAARWRVAQVDRQLTDPSLRAEFDTFFRQIAGTGLIWKSFGIDEADKSGVASEALVYHPWGKLDSPRFVADAYPPKFSER